VEKLQYLCWPQPGRAPAERGRQFLDEVVPALLALDPRGLSLQVDDADAQVAVPMPPPEDEPQPAALVSVWLDNYDTRAPYEEVLGAASDRIAGYLVTESLYTDYGGNRWSEPRDWPDGTRSPGVVMVTLLERPERMGYEEWIAHWHGVQSPVSEAIQPRTRYVRNAVARPVTAGAPPWLGIVEEAWGSPEDVTDPMRFYCADGDPARMQANLATMLDSVTTFLDLERIRSFTTSEYLLRT
jgi:hypothetical protein